MKFVSNCFILMGSFFVATTSLYAEETYFDFGGKTYKESDLPVSMRSSLYDLRMSEFQKTSQLIDGAILQIHLQAEAAKKKISVSQLEEQLFKAKEPTEKEMRDWYDKNKARIPYPFDKIKKDIKSLLVGEQKRGARSRFIADLKRKGKFKLRIKEPLAPILKFNDLESYPMKGNPKAKVTIVEFADFQCPHCKHAGETLTKLVNKYKKDVRLFFVDFPINQSGVSKLVAQGAVCARDQKKYWDYHQLAFSKQSALNKDSPASLAKELKLNMGEFKKCFDDPRSRAFVEKGKAEGDRIGVSGTPSIYINGRRVHGHDEASLAEAIERALKAAAS